MMDLNYLGIITIKLSLSTLFSFIIAFERELHTHPGGACTHILVGFGACLFTLISIHLKDKYQSLLKTLQIRENTQVHSAYCFPFCKNS